MIAEALREVSPNVDVPARAVHAAMCLPASGRVELFPGAKDLLVGLTERKVRVVIASNVVWRDAESHRRDFLDLELIDQVDAHVTSLDVG